jgi:hypothetical protein
LVDEYTRERFVFEESVDATSLATQLNAWNEAYQRIISSNRSPGNRPELPDEITRLDEVGLSLAQEIERLTPGSKVSYFSEGLGQRLWNGR